mgnify:CR=1 FL=1
MASRRAKPAVMGSGERTINDALWVRVSMAKTSEPRSVMPFMVLLIAVHSVARILVMGVMRSHRRCRWKIPVRVVMTGG